MKRKIPALILLFSILAACQGVDVVDTAENNASLESTQTGTALPASPTQTEIQNPTATPSAAIPSKTPRPPTLTPKIGRAHV